MQPLIDADIWKVVHKNYLINPYGELYSEVSGKMLKGYVGKNGYLYYTFWDGVREYAHRLVAKVFISNPNNLPHVNHIDHNPSNNHVSNLEWCTHQHNMKHSYTNPKRNKPKSYKHPNCKISDKDIIDIYKSTGTLREIANKFNVDQKTVYNIRNKGRHKHIIEKEVAYDSAIDRR